MTPSRTVHRGRRPILQVVRRLFAVSGALYGASLLILWAFQRPLVFHASDSRGADAGPAPPPGDAQTVQFRTDAGDSVVAYYGAALTPNGARDLDAARRPTLLFFYGQGGSVAGCRGWAESFRRQGVNVLMPDYVGFGASGGRESEAACRSTGEAALRYLRSRSGGQSRPIVIAGYSLGSGVAADLAARETEAGRPPAGLALFAAFTCMADEAHQEYPLYPTWLLRRLLRYPFPSERNLRRVRCPILLVHSRADRLIPLWMSDRLAQASGGPVTRLTIDRADHADYFTTGGAQVYPALGRFLKKAVTTR